MRNRLFTAAVLLAAVQVIHGAVPTGREDSEGSILGPIVGLVLIVASIVAAVGIRRGREWAPRLLAGTGLFVAVGFTLYHAIPLKNWATNPYWGNDVENVSLAAWATVAASVAVGLWAAWEATRVRTAQAFA